MSNRHHLCNFCNQYFHFKDIYEQHTVTCEYLYRNRRQRDREIDSHEILPSPQEQFKLIQYLTFKVSSMEKEIIKLRGSAATKQRKVISEWINNPQRVKPTVSFQDWGKMTITTFEHLYHVFEYDITEGMKFCFREYFKLNTPIPICAFIQKPGTIYIWTTCDSSDELQWRIMDSITYTKWIDRVAHRFLEIFLKWRLENAQQICLTEEEKDKNISNLRKINGLGQSYEDKRRNELRKWVFDHIAQDFIHNIEYEIV